MTAIWFGCRECGWRGLESEIVKFPDPESSAIWSICPKCRSAEQFDNLCDEPGCDAKATCGWPTPDEGYRRTCCKHMENRDLRFPNHPENSSKINSEK